jgi:predicted metal-dependent hydrolase
VTAVEKDVNVMLTLRRPRFDFSDSKAHWGDNREAVLMFNGGAIIPTPIERYLIRVMRIAKQLLDPTVDAVLIETVEFFNKQEGQHYRLHNGLTEALCRSYPRLREFEAAFAADLENFLVNRSLAWNLAYCEGFESNGCATAELWVDGAVKELCGDHGSTPMRLWMWHMAEEFEHRAVVHDVLHRLYPDEAYELRCDGAALRQHTAGHGKAAAAYIAEADKRGMTSEEQATYDARATEAEATFAALCAERLQWVFDPAYDPSAIAPPRDYERVLRDYPGAETDASRR